MDIIALRKKHKTTIVEHAYRLCGISTSGATNKQEWIEFLLAGGHPKQMIAMLRSGASLPESRSSVAVTDELSTLSPHARQIYADLKRAIDQHHKDSH